MKALLDNNIIIHREAPRVINREIGILYNWLDRLHYEKCIHPASIEEFARFKNYAARDSFNIKLDSYSTLKSQAPLHSSVKSVSDVHDVNENDRTDTLLLNEVYSDRVDILITEDKKTHKKAGILGISDRVFKIESFLEKVNAENPDLADYKVLAVKKELCGNIRLDEPFFDSFREDYAGFDKWFNKKSEEPAYVCYSEDSISAFLYLKLETADEPYPDISPAFPRKRRLKIGTFKVALNGYRLGERFLKIVFDNAIRLGVEEIYVTAFDHRSEQQRLIDLLEDFGFEKHGLKSGATSDEAVFIRSMEPKLNPVNPKLSFPYFGRQSRAFLVPIYPEYHTSLLPDSILRTESPLDFVENEPHRNAISKVYISRRQMSAAIVCIHSR